MPESSTTPLDQNRLEHEAPAASPPQHSKAGKPATESATDFEQVFAKEVEVLAARRQAAGLDAQALVAASRESAGPYPGAGLGLIGLCLSGGGIRSASFSLGVLQALERAKLNHRFDYLSTVSGGGFTGTTLSSALHHARLDGTPFAFSKSSTSDAPIITHLRNQSSYLNPGGFLDTVRLPAIMVRGLLLNILALVPWLFLAALLTELYYLVAYKGTTALHYFVELIPMLVGGVPFVMLVLASPLIPRLERRAPHWRDRYERAFAASLLLLLCGVFSHFVLGVINLAIENPAETQRMSSTIATCWLVALGALVIAHRSVAARGTKRVLRQLLVTGAGLLVPLVLFDAYVFLSIQLTPDPYYEDSKDCVSAKSVDDFKRLNIINLGQTAVGRWLTRQDSAPAPWPFFSTRCANEATRSPICELDLKKPKWLKASSALTKVTDGGGCIDFVRDIGMLEQRDSCDIAIDSCRSARTTSEAAETCRINHGCNAEDPCPECSIEQKICELPWTSCENARQCCWHFRDERSLEWFDVSLSGNGATSATDKVDCVSLSVHRLPLTWLSPVKLAKHLAHRSDSKPGLRASLDHEDWVVAIALGLSLLAILVGFMTDANSLSLHGFYRDRLARAFVVRGRTKGPEGFDSASRLLLSDLAPERTGAPYPLLNATLNVSGGTESSVRFRRGSAFVFSPQFIGSQATGYVATRAMEAVDHELTLASAMAISAAAAGPNMGSFTSGSLAPLFALFNLRLGYWLVHPNRATNKWLLLKRPGNTHILREALGLIDARGNFVNVSDGGHFENLGAYELIRRKCRLIVVVDSEEDSLGQLKGLMTLTRLARIDFGTVITADLTTFQPSADKPAQPWFWATIHYGVSPDGSEEVGYLLYIKANMVAGVPPYVDAYRAQSPDFPHESTADQFFNEVQFECYRALGYHLGRLVTKNQQVLDQITDVLASAPGPARTMARESA